MAPTMRVAVRAFAAYREALGTACITVVADQGATPARLWKDLAARYPRLGALPKPVAFAVNEEFVPEAAELCDGDELVLIPPLSGGAAWVFHPAIEMAIGRTSDSLPTRGAIR